MMRHARLLSFLLAASAVAVSACEFQRTSSLNSPTAPSTGGGAVASPLKGRWMATTGSTLADAGVATGSGTKGAQPQDLGPASCSNFVWNANDVQSDGSVQGVFSATCSGGYRLSGSATGAMSGNVVTVNGLGTGDLNGTNCPFTITSTGQVEGDRIRFPYSATTCLGTYSGTTYLARSALPLPAQPTSAACSGSSGDAIVECVASQHPERLAAGVSHGTRVANMEFLRDRIIERGRCKGLDVAWNLKRGVGPHSIDALAWRTGGRVEVVDIGVGYDDTSQPLQLQWLIVAGPPGYDPYTRTFGCN